MLVSFYSKYCPRKSSTCITSGLAGNADSQAPPPGLWDQNLHLSKLSGWLVSTVMFQNHQVSKPVSASWKGNTVAFQPFIKHPPYARETKEGNLQPPSSRSFQQDTKKSSHLEAGFLMVNDRLSQLERHLQKEQYFLERTPDSWKHREENSPVIVTSEKRQGLCFGDSWVI